MPQTEKKQKRLDEIVSDLKRLSKELGKPNITISDCRMGSNEYAITWVRNNCGLNFNDLKKLAELPINGAGASSNGKRGVHTVVKEMGGERDCNKCDKKFQRTSINRAICPKCAAENAQESDYNVSIFSSGQARPKGRT